MIFKQSAMVAILFFKNKAKIFHRQNICMPGFPWAILQSEALAPIIREIRESFSKMTPFDLDGGVKDQIQHLKKILRPWFAISCFQIPNP